MVCDGKKYTYVEAINKLVARGSLVHMHMFPLWIIQKTPLWLACYKGHLAAAEMLIQKGAYVRAHVKDNDEKSQIRRLNCLGAAVKEGHKYVCMLSTVVLFCFIKLFGRSVWPALVRFNDTMYDTLS